MGLRFFNISEVKETENVNEANFLLKEEWLLLGVGNHSGTFYYLLGKTVKS